MNIMDNSEDTRCLYKYRDITNFRFFVDILLNKRLFGALYDDLNDPFEGILYSDLKVSRERKQVLREERGKCRICSLSKVHDDNLMWAHYANGHRGCCIELSVKPSKYWQKLDVDYSERPLAITENTTVEELLSHKLSPWRYEEEVRYVSQNGSKYLNIQITRIYLGYQMNQDDKTFIKKLVQKLAPGVTVEEMHKRVFLG